MLFKKIFLICIFFISFLDMTFQVNASSFGVSPAKYEVNFEPGFEESFKFNFIVPDPLLEFRVYAEGDLAQYVTLSTDKLVGGGTVNVNLKLPQNIELPGRHRLLIAAEPITPKTGAGTTIGIMGAAMGLIAVYVPYPGQYADVEFEVDDSNAGQPANYKLKVYSRGEEEITVSPRIEVFNSRNESVKTYHLEVVKILPTDFMHIQDSFDTKGYGSGNYKAVVIVPYGEKEVRKEDDFKLGELNVRIINYTRELKKNKINPFEIEVESLWNDPIENLYAEVFVEGIDISFLTPSIELKPWQVGKLKGYFDTTGIKEEGLQLKMVLHYGDKTTEEIVILKFVKTTNYILIFSIFVGIIGLISLIIWIIVKIKKLEAKSDKRKKR